MSQESEDLYNHYDWEENELALLPYGFEPLEVLVNKNNADDVAFTAKWRTLQVATDHLRKPWNIIKQDKSIELITQNNHWELVHPGIKHITVTDWKTLTGTFQDKAVHWSKTNNTFLYDNNRRVHFPQKPDEEEEVSQLLESSTQILERTKTKLTPETTPAHVPGALPETPEQPRNPIPQAPRPGPSKVIPMQPRQTTTTTQQPTPPVSKSHTTMSTAKPDKALGTPPEPFDGTATKAEGFLSALQNYYYLNESLYSTESRRVAAALTHFQVGSAAGEWARDKQTAALEQTPINYGTWNDFINDFKKHFVPVQSEQQAMNTIWTLKMNNRPFHEWYQEWSTYASRSGANDATKMYAFRQALPAGLNDRLVGLSPAPTTLTDLVDKARLFDQQWQLWRKSQNTNSGQRPNTSPRIRHTATDDPNISYADTTQPNTKKGKLSKEEREQRFKSGVCLYCGKKGHFARECRSRPNTNQTGRPCYNNPARTRATEVTTEHPTEEPKPDNAATVAQVYQDPQYHFVTPDSQSIDPSEDF